MPKIKNILIFLGVAIVFVLIYIFFIKPSPEKVGTLTSSPGVSAVSNTGASNTDGASMTQEFLTVLLNVKSIKLDTAILLSNAFASLHDSSITLTQDGDEGRANPFAPIGSDVVVSSTLTCTLPKVLDSSTNTCVDPAPLVCTAPKILNTLTNTCVNPPPTCIPPKVLNSLTNTCVNPPSN